MWELIEAVTPPRTGGEQLCIVGRFTTGSQKPHMKHFWYLQGEDWFTKNRPHLSKAKDVYFGLASFLPDGETGDLRRRGVNAHLVKALWFDIDVGKENNSYATMDDAVRAIYAFVRQHPQLRPSYIVESGSGLQVFYALTTALPVNVWAMLAKGLAGCATHSGLIYDPSRTEDVASIMRLENSTHSGTGKVVKISFRGEHHNPVELAKYLKNFTQYSPKGRHANKAPQVTGAVPEWMSSPLVAEVYDYQAARTESVMQLLASSVGGVGCNQLKYCVENRRTLQYPMWRAALSIANCGVDYAEAIRAVSEGHPDFDQHAAEKRAADTAGPHLCATFAAINPAGCQGCLYAHTSVKSPIQLSNSELVINFGKTPAPTPEPLPAVVQPHGIVPMQSRAFQVPQIIAPYFRPTDGGVARVDERREKGGFGMVSQVPVLLWKHDLYKYRRGHDAGGVLHLHCRHHTPNDGVIEFTLSGKELNAPEAFALAMQRGHVLCGTKERAELMQYLIHQSNHLQEEQVTDEQVSQMGWTEKNTFILGEFEYTKDGPIEAPPPNKTVATKFRNATSAKHRADGKIDGWRNLCSTLYPNGYREALAGQYMVCASMGAPIVAACSSDEMRGGLIHLYSEGSGHGKSLATDMAQRVFGDPSQFSIAGGPQGGTDNAVFLQLSYLNSIPLTRDEMTGMDAKALGELVYGLTNRAGKIRMGDANDIRQDTNRWGTYVFGSSNMSLLTAIPEDKGSAMGKLARVTELRMHPLTWHKNTDDYTRVADMINGANQYNGVAGHALAEWMVANFDEMQRKYKEVYNEILRRVGTDQYSRVRYWVNHATGVVMGALVGAQLGLHAFDLNALILFAIEQVQDMYKASQAAYKPMEELFAQFFNDHAPFHYSAPMNDVEKFTNAPLRKYDVIAIRTERSAKSVWITTRAVAEYCRLHRLDRSRFEAYLTTNLHAEKSTKRMYAGTELSSTPAATAWKFKIDETSPFWTNNEEK